MRKLSVWSRDKRALSPIFATVLLATIILIFGSVAYYYANNATSTATNSYVSTLTNSQQSIAERIGFENVVYSSSSSTLTVYIINSGSANNIKINSIFIYGSSHTIVGGSPYSGSQIPSLKTVDLGVSIPSLNVGYEGYFTLAMTGHSLTSGAIYTIHLITQSGSAFDYEFTA